MKGRVVTSVQQLLEAVEGDYVSWKTEAFPWFRGEPGGPRAQPLLPSLYRGEHEHDENRLLQFFRMRAPIMGLPIVPPLDRTDQWLFLARHVGLPTRLLDWTEGALVALLFAIREPEPVVWMLNPHALNEKSAPGGVPNPPTLTWFPGHPPERRNIYHANIAAAWDLGRGGTDLPVAIYPMNIHPFMAAQHSCFTVHGQIKKGLSELVDPECLRRYDIRMDRVETLQRLRRLGISEAGLFPDAQGLARELKTLF